MDASVPRANFVISPAAKEYLSGAIADGDRRSPVDPIVATAIGWGGYTCNSGLSHEGLVVGFYNRSNLPEIASALQTVSGIAVFFYVRPEDVAKFDGRTIDYDESDGLFLR